MPETPAPDLALDLLATAKAHARVDHDDDDTGLALMLKTAIAEIEGAANITIADDLAEVPHDLVFAICDQAARLYDLRGAEDGAQGLSLAASRIVARYRGIAI